jgi:hypothetical protein
VLDFEPDALDVDQVHAANGTTLPGEKSRGAPRQGQVRMTTARRLEIVGILCASRAGCLGPA